MARESDRPDACLNVRPDQPLKDQPDYNLFWEHLGGAVARHVSGRRMICGHTPQASGLPLEIVYRKEIGNRSEASKEEMRIKRMGVKGKVGLVNGG